MFSHNPFPPSDSIAYWLRHSIREWQVEGSNPSGMGSLVAAGYLHNGTKSLSAQCLETHMTRAVTMFR